MEHSTPHSNAFGCVIKHVDGKGRGVFATTSIPAQTTIDVSLVLLFAKEEYDSHGRFTILDSYTFKWREGQMALALGLGSLFNHSNQPNVSYSLDFDQECIRFTTTRQIMPGEELCIYYGNTLWFQDSSAENNQNTLEDETYGDDDNFGIYLHDDITAHLPGRKMELITEEDLPFEKVGPSSWGEEEDEDEVQTVNAWVVDVPDSKKISQLIQWLKMSNLEDETLKHVKHVRRWADAENKSMKTSLLLASAEEDPPSPPDGLIPYVAPVPRFPARTMEQVKIKSTIWPVFYEAHGHKERKDEAQRWTQSTIQWFRRAINAIRHEAKRVRTLGELPIVAYVPAPPDDPGAQSFIAHDTRISSEHCLRHAVFNLLREVGVSIPQSELRRTQNGQNYLLNTKTLFITHEPCIACSMALLHSRVKEIVYIYPMPQTGGCGGLVCVPGLKGVNHRYKIWKWRGVPESEGDVNTSIDA